MLRNPFELSVLPYRRCTRKIVFQPKLRSYYTLHDKPVNFAEVRLVHC